MDLISQIDYFAATRRNSVAIVCNEVFINYSDLMIQSKQIAKQLRLLEVSEQDIIAIYLPRSVDIVIALCGVVRSSAIYTIIEDDGNFEENLNRLFNTGAKLVITTTCHVGNLQERGFNVLTSREWEKIDPNDSNYRIKTTNVAYILYTSGSTGKPKGVAITHDNIEHYTTSLIQALQLAQPLQYAHVSTFAADLGNTGLFLSLWTGGTLHILDDEIRKDPRALSNYLINHKIDFIKITPSHWNAVFQCLDISKTDLNLEYLIFGGEPLPKKLVEGTFNINIANNIVNHYGPTETTVGVIINILKNKEQLISVKTETIALGKPFGETEILIEVADNIYQTYSTKGELLIAGPSVGKGYINDEENTNKKFIFYNNKRYYKTGDLVTSDENGVITFDGRIDRQVKINGYRVELEHIEKIIGSLTSIKHVIVHYIEINGKYKLVATLNSSSATNDITELKNWCKRHMPAYMIPEKFIFFANFPINSNGKIDIKQLTNLVKEELEIPNKLLVTNLVTDPLINELISIWKKYLKHDNIGLDDSFFDLGGNSLDAILMISELQAKNQAITTSEFLKYPTINHLHKYLNSIRPEKHTVTPIYKSQKLSPIQTWFFEQSFLNHNHWNQCILLQSNIRLNPDTLQLALEKILIKHPLLHTSYQIKKTNLLAELDKIENHFSFSECNETDPKKIQQHINEVTQNLHGSINVYQGIIFKVHLFRLKSEADQLVLISHHLSVDMISWRLIVNDLVNFYHNDISISNDKYTYWNWVEHIQSNKNIFLKDISYWQKSLKSEIMDRPSAITLSNLEKNASTGWLVFSPEESSAITQQLPNDLSCSIHILILAIFSFIYAKMEKTISFNVDVESHGRISFDPTIDVSHIVGWFTSMFPISLDIDINNLTATIDNVADNMTNIPNLGIAYAVHKNEMAAISQTTICYNYLGNIDFSSGTHLHFTPSVYKPSHARGNENNRIHELKLTAKLLNRQLVIDLSFLPEKHSPEKINTLMSEMRDLLLTLVNNNHYDKKPIYFEAGSTTGLLTYLPESLKQLPSSSFKKRYKNVLLTGATGFIGIHIFRQLLINTDAHIYCLIRPTISTDIFERLSNIYHWYFPNDSLKGFSSRFSVISGNIEEGKFDLSPPLYNELCNKIDAIYHFAANTKLFGDDSAFKKQNLYSIQSIINLAQSGCQKEIHYMSTLAIAGLNTKPHAVLFNENSLYIEQQFQNEYERSKYNAEKLLHEYIQSGGNAYIYRSGNVSGNSITGKFQINAHENRFIQFLQAITKLGKIPNTIRDTIVLSPVDLVAEGIVALALDSNTLPGVFHVDSDKEVSLHDLIKNLIKSGIQLEKTEEHDWLSLFGKYSAYNDPIINIGHYWAKRPDRNIRFDHSKTLHLLNQFNCNFHQLNDTWQTHFLQDLIARNIFHFNYEEK